MELHPHFQQPALFEYVRKHGIEAVGYSPLGSPRRPERDRTPEDTSPLDDPAIVRIARRLGIHPAIVCLKWALQRGQSAIPFSINPRNYTANLHAAEGESLTAQDMRDIAAIDQNCRLVKGHVFLWKAGQTWEDLWDLQGHITPA
jgi:diketogulonate reductase-like aldo/keto reductase